MFYSVEPTTNGRTKGRPVGGFLNGEAPPRLRSVKSLRLQSLALLLRHLLVRAVQLEINALLARLSLGFLRVRQAAGERGFREESVSAAARKNNGSLFRPRSDAPRLSQSSVRDGKKTQEPRGKNLGKSRATLPAFRADSASASFPGRDARTFAALLAAFFSCFSRSTAAMISICVKGRFSRFFDLPLLRRPSPNSTWLCSSGCAKVNRG